MNHKTTIQDIIDALGMANLLVSVNGETPCNAVMALYTDSLGKARAADEISGITYNSKEVSEGSLFVCKGANFKEEYLAEALSSGAACYVRQDPEGRVYDPDACALTAGDTDLSGIFKADEPVEIYVSDIRRAMPVIAEAYYGKLSDEINVIGITGTKGKSSTAYFMRYIIDRYMSSEGGAGCAICSGIDTYDGITDEASHITTPETFELYKHLDNACRSGIKYMIMEVSSQALKYHRVDGIEFKAGTFLNIGSDHISPIEHPDMDDYLNSKLRIFAQSRHACFSLDTDHADSVYEASGACGDVITFSSRDESANVYAYDINSHEGHVVMQVRGRGISGYDDFDEEFALGAIGRVNAENALAAISLSALLKIPMEHVKSGLAEARVPGRMEVYKSEDGRRIAFVDYAHNALSFEKFYEMAEADFPDKKIISVFGSAGGKALNRRAELGRSAGIHSDYSILTEDDSGPEDIYSICSEIAEHLEAAGGRYEIVTDRAEAIRKAVSMMDDDTILFVAGRGSDTGMKRRGGSIDYPADTEVVKEFLK